MSRNAMKTIVPAVLLGLLCAHPAMSRDVGVEQYNVSAAEHEYEEAQTGLEDVNARVRAQEKRIADEQARLKELQKEQVAARARVAKARNDLEQKQKALDRAWSAGGK